MSEKQSSIFADNPFLTKEGIWAFLISFGCVLVVTMTIEEYECVVLSGTIAVVAGFFLCYYKSNRPNRALLRFSFLLMLLLSCFLFSNEVKLTEYNGPLSKSKGMLLWIGIILYGLLDGVANRMRVRRRKICLSEISAWNRRNGVESEALPIHANNGETYCIISIDEGKQIAVNIDCRPTKQGYYKCAWVWNDPKDGEHYFLTPNNYKILFCFNTGNIEIEELKGR